ncbi:MAG: DUF4337 domain-containing protein [Cryobacterium sp.]|nr:DUF4337 domain-containing protein [Oligoflexia bacterium]
MEETEVPTEHLQEELEHRASHASPAERWISGVALSSALFAALAAVSALESGHHSNEAMLEQIRSSDHWAQYQAKGVKAAVLKTRIEILTAFGKPTSDSDHEKLKEYEHQQAEISTSAKEEEAASKGHLEAHHDFAKAVTFSQIAIALGAISVLTRRKKFWWVALSGGVFGAFFLVQGFLFARHL